VKLIDSPGFLASYWSARFWDISSGIGPASHWLEDCADFTPTLEGNNQYGTAPTTLSAIQAASQSTLSIHNYTALVY